MADTEATSGVSQPPSEVGEDVETRVRVAMASRVPYFKEQANSLTFEGVRRVLEKDLGLETYALDVHKRFVKNCLQELLESAVDEAGKSSVDTEDKGSTMNGEKSESTEPKKGEKDTRSTGGDEETKTETSSEKPKDTGYSTIPSEAMIKKALAKKASHLRENSENITLAGVRRLLEEDLNLDKYALDAKKKFITEQVNEVLMSSKVSLSGTVDQKSKIGKIMTSKSRKDDLSSSSQSMSSEDEEDEVKPRKRTAVKSKPQNSKGLKRRKRANEDLKEPIKNRSKASKQTLVSEGDDEDNSGAENSDLSAERPMKKKEVQKPLYGKRVEHLKSVIKSCGMSVPPSIYKKVKQAPESQQESALIKQLEDILAKEGLGPNPSEKEIKDIKKKKERARELEGIDMSNIVSSSRRRSTASYAPPPKPKVPVESDAESGESGEEEDDEDDDDDDDDEVDEQEDGDDGKSEEDDDAGDSD